MKIRLSGKNAKVRVQSFIFAADKYESMGKIQIEQMEFYAYHGHFKEEQIVGNKFLVDLSIETDMALASVSDDLKDAVNYQRAYQLVKTEMEKKSHLLENIARRILDVLFEELSGIEEISVQVSKMNPPVGGKMDCVSVTMGRDMEGNYF
ncbi:MAG: dihydroneopterin aldolase [Bacteroidales bacterium]|nr:dihydroneopterin aldolase [Bacteroidales bacterium]